LTRCLLCERSDCIHSATRQSQIAISKSKSRELMKIGANKTHSDVILIPHSPGSCLRVQRPFACGGEVALRTKRRATAFGETDRNDLSRVVRLIVESSNAPWSSVTQMRHLRLWFKRSVAPTKRLAKESPTRQREAYATSGDRPDDQTTDLSS